MTTFAPPLRFTPAKRILSALVTAGLFGTTVVACSSDGNQATNHESEATHTVTDALGREVEVPENVDRILMGDSGCSTPRQS